MLLLNFNLPNIYIISIIYLQTVIYIFQTHCVFNPKHPLPQTSQTNRKKIDRKGWWDVAGNPYSNPQTPFIPGAVLVTQDTVSEFVRG